MDDTSPALLMLLGAIVSAVLTPALGLLLDRATPRAPSATARGLAMLAAANGMWACAANPAFFPEADPDAAGFLAFALVGVVLFGVALRAFAQAGAARDLDAPGLAALAGGSLLWLLSGAVPSADEALSGPLSPRAADAWEGALLALAAAAFGWATWRFLRARP